MCNIFSCITRRRKRKEEADETRRMINNSIGHINDIHGFLGLEPMPDQEETNISLTLARIDNQLSNIFHILTLGDYSPRGELQKEMRRIEDERDSLQGKLQKQIEQTDEMRRQAEEQSNFIGKLNKQLDAQKKSDAYLSTIKHMISFRDQLFSQLGYARAGDDEKGICIIEGIITILSDTLRESGVVILDQCGEYDPKSQYVSGTVQTEDRDLDMHIKETTREGYLLDGKLIRQQEVVVYRYGKEGHYGSLRS